MSTRDNTIQESIGGRIGRLRRDNGWTQQALADRLAISRVAVSHIEMDLTVPGERTITLLAGVFKLSPHKLVDGTTYPMTKSERLPSITCCYTQLELDLALMNNDLTWLNRLSEIPDGKTHTLRYRDKIIDKWSNYLSKFLPEYTAHQEKKQLAQARQILNKIIAS